MHDFSLWQWIVSLLLIVIVALLGGGFFWLFTQLSNQKKTSGSLSEPATKKSPDARLHNLKHLLDQGHITEEEYKQQRADIIAGV